MRQKIEEVHYEVMRMDTNFSDNAIWESAASPFIIIESTSGEVDGVHILAKVEGPAFFPETTSRNSVFYPLEAWESAISDPEFVARLSDRLVYGTIGHNAELSDDDIREGRFSHIVTRVWIDESNVGRAEYLILNTNVGKILNTLLRSGSKLRVSTKAEGYFENGSNSKVKIVIPDSFKLERIDFVIDPGYREALPQVTESLSDDPKLQSSNSTGVKMDDKVVSILEARVTELKTEHQSLQTQIQEANKTISSLNEAVAVGKSELGNYTQLGTFASVQEALSELAQYQRIGSVHEIHEALEQGQEVIDDMSGTITDLKDKLEDQPEEYQDLGTPGDIRTALDQALTAVDELQTYRELGSVEEISDLIAKTDEMAETMEQEAAANCAAEHGVDPSVVATLLGKGMSLEECNEFLTSLKPAVSEEEQEDPTKVPGYVAPAQEPGTGEEEEEEEQEEEEEEEDPAKVSESRSSKALRNLRKGSQPRKIVESKKNGENTRLARLMS